MKEGVRIPPWPMKEMTPTFAFLNLSAAVWLEHKRGQRERLLD